MSFVRVSLKDGIPGSNNLLNIPRRNFIKTKNRIFQIRIQHHIIAYKIIYQMHFLIFDSEFRGEYFGNYSKNILARNSVFWGHPNITKRDEF
jgi:hypothetical protein